MCLGEKQQISILFLLVCLDWDSSSTTDAVPLNRLCQDLVAVCFLLQAFLFYNFNALHSTLFTIIILIYSAVNKEMCHFFCWKGGGPVFLKFGRNRQSWKFLFKLIVTKTSCRITPLKKPLIFVNDIFNCVTPTVYIIDLMLITNNLIKFFRIMH